MTTNLGTLHLGRIEFPITTSTCRYYADNGQGVPGWDFEISTGAPRGVTTRHSLAGRSVRFYSEADPIPLLRHTNLVGVTLRLEEPFDPDSGEVYFTLYVYEHGDLVDLTLKFTDRKADRYRMLVSARTPAGSLYSRSTRVRIDTWIKQLPSRRTLRGAA